MTTAGKKILVYYEEGRITATGAIIRLLELSSREEMEDTIEACPPDLLEKLKEFLREYRPDMRIFPPQPPPSPAAVEMAREVLAEPVKSGS
jgi:hypothetical protein